jgi:hypothetical protein
VDSLRGGFASKLSGGYRSGSSPWIFDLEVEHIRGYDKYNFFFNEDLFPDAVEALDSLLHDILQELDIYYLVQQHESEKIFAWTRISTLLQSLVELHQRRGLRAFFTRTFKSSRLVNDTFVSLAEFEGNAVLEDNILRNSYRDTYTSDTTPFLREIVEGKMDERASYPTEQVRSLLQLFETRRLSAAQLRVVLISAISGGAFGALITALIKGN